MSAQTYRIELRGLRLLRDHAGGQWRANQVWPWDRVGFQSPNIVRLLDESGRPLPAGWFGSVFIADAHAPTARRLIRRAERQVSRARGYFWVEFRDTRRADRIGMMVVGIFVGGLASAGIWNSAITGAISVILGFAFGALVAAGFLRLNSAKCRVRSVRLDSRTLTITPFAGSPSSILVEHVQLIGRGFFGGPTLQLHGGTTVSISGIELGVENRLQVLITELTRRGIPRSAPRPVSAWRLFWTCTALGQIAGVFAAWGAANGLLHMPHSPLASYFTIAFLPLPLGAAIVGAHLCAERFFASVGAWFRARRRRRGANARSALRP